MGEAVGVGLAFVLLGGLLQGTFTLPMKRMPAWQWENTWLVYSIVSMLVLPWLLVAVSVPRAGDILGQSSTASLVKVAIFGFGWGVGSVFFGLGIAAVGMGLGFAIILGLTASIGSLLPLIVLDPERLFTHQGYALMIGMALVIAGIVLCAIAGSRREREKTASIAKSGGESAQTGRSRFLIGLLICTLSGIFSPMLNFSFVFGKNLQELTLKSGATPAMASNLVWGVALGAGFLANAGYCVYLLQRNRTWGLLTRRGIPAAYWLGTVIMAILWFGGIAAYGIGAAGLGALGGVIGWPLFMAMIIITANLWGALTGEWKGTARSTYAYSWSGIGILLVAIYVISRGSAA
jgi:L-rhamnose-H+ transport protein